LELRSPTLDMPGDRGSASTEGMTPTLQLADGASFRAVREFLRSANFNEGAVCRALGLENMGELGKVQLQKPDLTKCESRLRWCIEVFVLGQRASGEPSRTICGEPALAALDALGLIRPSRKEPEKVLCPFWLYPAAGFLITSDRREDPEDEPFRPAADVVFPAIYPGTLRFLQLLPDVRMGDALDLCGGTGIGALQLSRTSRQAVTTDLTPRSALFAEFNARLNDASVASLCGDVYSPIGDRQFDVISAHPPFVPATGDTMVYRDGGATGEEVTRRIIEGVPAHLRPGGTCVVLCVARDTQEQTFEQRASEWLGRERDGFEIIFGLEKILSVEEVVDSMRKRGQELRDAQAENLLNRLRSLGTRQFVYGALWIKRDANELGNDPQQQSKRLRRVRMTPTGSAADFEKLLAWRERCRQPRFHEWLAQSRPRLAPELELRARHIVKAGELVPAEFVFSIEAGFEAALHPDGWVVPLIARLEGKLSVAEVYENARAAQEMPKGFHLKDFADLISVMIDRGFLVLSDVG
jgi:SAM-dependent methyltransferase